MYTSKVINGHKRINDNNVLSSIANDLLHVLYNLIELYMYLLEWHSMCKCASTPGTWAVFLIVMLCVKIYVLIFCFLEVYEEDLYGKIINNYWMRLL